ncbi:MAG: CRR6 family NdhI maturation factor [Gloeomargarita sp. SKYB31]|nr:CRR6 family NdhI maturation factor [Gloeomargarita sp. SKYB31]
MTVLEIPVSRSVIERLDLQPVQQVLPPDKPPAPDLQIRFAIDFPRDPTDPRELSEVPEVRLWFIRLDAHYPWLPLFLDWQQELARYVAMLVPHQFSPREGIQFNPEALDIFLMGKVFYLYHWLRQQGWEREGKLIQMVEVLGYQLDPELFRILAATGD